MRPNIKLRSGVVVPNSDTIMGGAYVPWSGQCTDRHFALAPPPCCSEQVDTWANLLTMSGSKVNTANTYTFGGADSVVEIIVEIPSRSDSPDGFGAAGTDGTDGAAGPGWCRRSRGSPRTGSKDQ